jgi:hypothetical protein
MAVGILAYGSLLDDLGEELSARIVRCTDGVVVAACAPCVGRMGSRSSRR